MSAQDHKDFERRQEEEEEADEQTQKRNVPWGSSIETMSVAEGEAEGLKEEGGGGRRRRSFHGLEMAHGLRPVVAQTCVSVLSALPVRVIWVG